MIAMFDVEMIEKAMMTEVDWRRQHAGHKILDKSFPADSGTVLAWRCEKCSVLYVREVKIRDGEEGSTAQEG